MMTSKALTKMGIRHYVVVEPQEVDKYKKASSGLLCTILELDMNYKAKYESCDKFGLSKSTGSGPARNFIWDHSIKDGFKRHWIMDDNICRFWRFNKNMKIPCASASMWTAMEDFCLRYKNIAMAGPNYYFFIPRKSKTHPIIKNTRIYSCNLILNDLPFRWRGRYNEDTILSLDILSKGWCTALFNAFLQDKEDTQKMAGGNTDELYGGVAHAGAGAKRYNTGGTTTKSLMLAQQYPDIVKLAYRFNREHHIVDYKKFKNNKFIKTDEEIKRASRGNNNYGMELMKIKK